MSSFKIFVLGFLPSLSPLFGIVSVVPVGDKDFSELPFSVRIFDTVTVVIKLIFTSGLRKPFSVFIQRSHCEHNVRMRIVTFGIRIVDCDICDHTFGDKLLLNMFLEHLDICLHRKLDRQGDLYPSGQLCIPVRFRFLDRVP